MVQSIAMGVSVCLSVLYICRLAYIKATCPNFTKFLAHVKIVAVAWSSADDSAIYKTSGFVDDVTFSHNGANGAESNYMKDDVMFRRAHQMAARRRSCCLRMPHSVISLQQYTL